MSDIDSHGDADTFRPDIVAMLRDAAMARGIGGGRPEKILSHLEALCAGLFPAQRLFPHFFAVPSRPAATPWEIGEAFWRNAPISRGERRRAGCFYTPAGTIDRVLDMVWRDFSPPMDETLASAALCDPALGCGFFPLRLVERMLAGRHSLRSVREWASRSLYGVDTDRGAVFIARALLWLSLSDRSAIFLPDPGHFLRGDSLCGPAFGEDGPGQGLDWAEAFPGVTANGGFSHIVGNPPYEVLTNFGSNEESRTLARALRESGYYRDSLHGQVNLYRCFIERSLTLLRPGGSLAFIVPLSLARDAAAQPLRRRLMLREDTGQWRLFGERDGIFLGVTQSACIFKAVKDGGKAESLSVHSRGDTVRLRVDRLVEWTGGSLSIPMLDRKGAALWKWLWRHTSASLEDAAEMRVGEVDQTFFRDCMSDTDTGCLLARGAHCSPFQLDVAAVPGKERFLRLEEFLRKKGKAAAACRERAGRWRVVQLGIRNIHSLPRLVAALCPPGVYPGNSLNVYLPRAGVSCAYLAGVLNSAILDWMFRLNSGNNNINLHEIRRLPFPLDADAGLMQAVERAYGECAVLAAKGQDLAIARAALDRAVSACYGVPVDMLEPVFADVPAL